MTKQQARRVYYAATGYSNGCSLTRMHIASCFEAYWSTRRFKPTTKARIASGRRRLLASAP